MRKEPIRKSILRKTLTAAAAAMILCFPISAEATETIACIGDSLTYGFIPFMGTKEVTYPDVLNELLGDDFEVLGGNVHGEGEVAVIHVSTLVDIQSVELGIG